MTLPIAEVKGLSLSSFSICDSLRGVDGRLSGQSMKQPEQGVKSEEIIIFKDRTM